MENKDFFKKIGGHTSSSLVMIPSHFQEQMRSFVFFLSAWGSCRNILLYGFLFVFCEGGKEDLVIDL